jgi:fimbrial isopeptide formation D2 family protein/LPXTG-motif cell wall-anchored protein
MKKFSKILSVALLVALVLSLGVSSAFAADDGTITISNTTQDAAYNVYKVFDATYSGNNVAYFYDGSNATFLANLQASTSPFTVTETLDGDYNVVPKSDATEEGIITFIKNNAANFGDPVKTGTGNDGALTFNGLAYGYYYITSGVGAVVTIDSALKDVTVIDKNQETTLDKEEKIANGTWQYDGEYSDSITPPTGNVGDTVSYNVEGTWTRYIGEDIVKNLKFHDVMSSGLTADQNVVVKFGDTTLTAVTENPGQGQYTVTYVLNNNDTPNDATDDYWVTDIFIPVASFPADADPVFFYNVTNNYEITYSAKIDKDAIIDGEEINTVDLKYDDKNGNENEVDSDKTKLKDFPLNLLKVDGKNTETTTDDSPLAGAKFELYRKDGTTPISVVLLTGTNYGDGTATAEKDNVYRLAEAGETGDTVITEMVVGKTGKITVQGLANGQYEFEETEAPAGFNKLTARTNVVTIENNAADSPATVTAINNHGTELPSTGGIGTTIFYAVGGILVLAAIVLLITKKRMSD